MRFAAPEKNVKTEGRKNPKRKIRLKYEFV